MYSKHSKASTTFGIDRINHEKYQFFLPLELLPNGSKNICTSSTLKSKFRKLERRVMHFVWGKIAYYPPTLPPPRKKPRCAHFLLIQQCAAPRTYRRAVPAIVLDWGSLSVAENCKALSLLSTTTKKVVGALSVVGATKMNFFQKTYQKITSITRFRVILKNLTF